MSRVTPAEVRDAMPGPWVDVELIADELNQVTFRVRGIPVPQGTARAFVAGGRAFLATDANRPNSPIGAWRAAIRTEAQRGMGRQPLIAGAVRIRAGFSMPRPRSLPKRVTQADAKPDLDKLARALLDALTGVVIRDDAQVVALELSKGYDEGEPGVMVTVLELPGGRR
jgi:crossover junction endodeoxyribonuclease RusA